MKHTKIKQYIPNFLKIFFKYLLHCLDFDIFMSRSYSQAGEDMLLKHLLGKKSNGFYVDVGAYHPKKFSNTFIFYKMGWHGINIEPRPNSIKKFTRTRAKDINLELAIAKQEKTLTYYQFQEPAFNSFSEEAAFSKKNREIITKTLIQAYPLRKILEQYLNHTSEIDFFSIDVEGLDLEVLKSNDWSKFRPKVVVVEILGSSIEEVQHDPIYNYLVDQNYNLYAKAGNSVFFISDNFLQERIAKRSKALTIK